MNDLIKTEFFVLKLKLFSHRLLFNILSPNNNFLK